VSTMAARIADLETRVRRAAEGAGRTRESVRIIAVTKRHSASSVLEAYRLGLRAFGENYAQELTAKAAEIGPLHGLEWHMIGHLQTNKARLLAPTIHAIHTIDSAHVASELGKRAAKLGRTIDALVEVKLASDAAKTGCAPSEIPDVLAAVRGSSALRLRGLMTVPPYSDDPGAARGFFAELRALQTQYGGPSVLPELSMGMSHDLEVAIAEGATIVRVGTAIFGERPD
jgi:PLP dependent protein